MKLSQIIELLNAKVRTNNFSPDKNIKKGLASDLMSDVLTLSTDDGLLITGLNNVQTIRTAEMAEIVVVVIVRNKKISDEMLKIAEENEIVVLECKYSLFKAAGILYSNGLESVY